MNKIKRLIKDSIFYKPLRSIYQFFVVLFYPYGYIRNYIYFPIAGFLRKAHIGKGYREYKYIESYKNKHLGKRCFILATGPSLRTEDVNKLKNELTFAVNSFYRIFDETDFRPDYYFVMDPDVHKKVMCSCKYETKDMAKDSYFMNSMVKEKDASIKYIPYCYQDHWFNIFNQKYRYDKNLKFSDDLLYGLFDKYTVTVSAIETAIYMGCKEVYLLGVDCNYSGPKIHFGASDSGSFLPDELQAAMTQEAMMTGYKFLKEEAEKRGIKIYNATRGGMLEVFERVDFDSIVN